MSGRLKRVLRNPVTWVVAAIVVVLVGSFILALSVDLPRDESGLWEWPVVLFRIKAHPASTAFELTGWGGVVLVGLGWALTRIGRSG